MTFYGYSIHLKLQNHVWNFKYNLKYVALKMFSENLKKFFLKFVIKKMCLVILLKHIHEIVSSVFLF